MYKCNKCNKNLCIKCNKKLGYKTTNYDINNFVCAKHNENYCKTCKLNIFSIWYISYEPMIINKYELINKLNEYKNDLDKFNNDLNNVLIN